MVYHWQSHNAKLCGVDDMVLLPRGTEEAIVENLRKRYMDDYIYTRIGPVLVSVNPFKHMSYFSKKDMDLYQGAAPYENPPHIYGLSDEMYRNLWIDNESQCVIISGESGAGKTVAARYIMEYIASVSGGTAKVQHVNDVVLGSNPLLEAFGNAKTIRNDNSSRFGKYVEIIFGSAGQPDGGRISNFLLEKSRVTNLTHGERSFHIFYQVCAGLHPTLRDELGLVPPESFQYLSCGGSYEVSGLNDAKNFQETHKAMRVMGLSDQQQGDLWKIIAAVLHLGNISFQENGNYACVYDQADLAWPAYLLSIDQGELETKLVSRRFDSKWGTQADSIDVTLNVEQATYTRDAVAKSIYARVFDYLVERVNAAMSTTNKGNSIGILDIYGFEILEKNGFEQFCINFVNEKLQQIFIQLTLKAEQEEYVAENISWTTIDYFNNQVVCELMEGRRPPGLFLVVDDVCATLHAVAADGADQDLQKKMNVAAGDHKHYSRAKDGFVIQHYAGTVHYSVDGFCDRNRDVLSPDLVQLLQTSSNPFIRGLFPEQVSQNNKRPTTAGNKIRTQANELVGRLMLCAPHYIRCIKPNESKKPHDWDDLRVKHQVEYLGLRENIAVRRAGFAYRRPFQRFLYRYSILTPETWARWPRDDRAGVLHILCCAGLEERSDFQLGKTKIFIKTPESVFRLEDLREQQYDKHARVIQKAFKQHFARKQRDVQRIHAHALVCGMKERRRQSINRCFASDYIGLGGRPDLQALIGRRERVVFAMSVNKYDRRFKVSQRDMILTSRSFLLVGMEAMPGGGRNAPLQPVVKRNIPFPNISHVTLSTFQDDFIVLHVKDDFDSLLEVTFKTELLSALSKKYKEQTGRSLNIVFSNSVDFHVKKSGIGGGGMRQVMFVPSGTDALHPTLRVAGYTLTVAVGPGLPADTPLAASYPAVGRKFRNAPAKSTFSNGRVPASTRAAPTRPAPTRAAPPPPGHAPPTQPASHVTPPRPKELPTHQRAPLKSPPGAWPSLPSPATVPMIAVRAPPPRPTGPTSPSGMVVSPPRPTGPTSPPGMVPILGVRPPLPQSTRPTTESTQQDQRSPLSPNGNGGSTMKLPGLKPGAGADLNQELATTLRRMKARKENRVVSPERIERNGTNNGAAAVPAAKPVPGGPVPKPVPGGGRPKPKPSVKPDISRVKALFEYTAQDTDELSFKEGDVLELLKEHDGGWWQGRFLGKEGFFPGNYVEKL